MITPATGRKNRRFAAVPAYSATTVKWISPS